MSPPTSFTIVIFWSDVRRGALRYSLAVRARPRAVWVRLGPRDPLGGGTAPSTYDLTNDSNCRCGIPSTTCTENSA